MARLALDLDLAPVVLDDDIDPVRLGELTETSQAVGREFLLFLVVALAAGVDPDAVAAEELRGFDPTVVIAHCLCTLVGIRVAEVALTIAQISTDFTP